MKICKIRNLSPVHTNTFSKVCVFVVIENASIDSPPHYLFDEFSTVCTKTFESDRIECCDVRFRFLNRFLFSEEESTLHG